MNPPNPRHWTLNLCFHKLHCVWVHLLWFRNYMKLCAKRCELMQLMQKFVPRIHDAIFDTERTQSNPLEPKPMFWCVLQCLDAFGIISLLLKLCVKRAELVQLTQKFMPRSRVGTFRYERTRSTPVDSKLMFCCIS